MPNDKTKDWINAKGNETGRLGDETMNEVYDRRFYEEISRASRSKIVVGKGREKDKPDHQIPND